MWFEFDKTLGIVLKLKPNGEIGFRPIPTLLEYMVRNMDNHMSSWKVIALINDEIEAVSGPAAQDRPGVHVEMVWEGTAADNGEALQRAEKAGPSLRFCCRPWRAEWETM